MLLHRWRARDRAEERRCSFGQRSAAVRFFNTDATAGRLRLKRVGSALEFAVSEGATGEFQILHEHEFVTGDVTLLRAALKQSDPATPAEIAVTSFAVHADELPQLPSELARDEQLHVPRYHPPPARTSRAWLWQAGLGLVLFSGAVAWFIHRRRT